MILLQSTAWAATCCWRPANGRWPWQRKSEGAALAIDAKDEGAARWYERFGALPLLDDPLKLILPLSVIADAIRTAGKRR